MCSFHPTVCLYVASSHPPFFGQFWWPHHILGDPGAVSGGDGQLIGTTGFSGGSFARNSRRPDKLSVAPTNCPWVSEDDHTKVQCKILDKPTGSVKSICTGPVTRKGLFSSSTKTTRSTVICVVLQFALQGYTSGKVGSSILLLLILINTNAWTLLLSMHWCVILCKSTMIEISIFFF